MTLIRELAKEIGFQESYVNCFGKPVNADIDAVKSLVKAMGFCIDTDSDIEAAIKSLRLGRMQRLIDRGG